jgi:hypothetical protein
LLLCAVLGAVAVGPAARAQVPPVPPQVADALDQANETLGPVLLQGADAAQPVVNAGGVALRPLCIRGSTISLAVGLAGLGFDPTIVTGPLAAFCKGALRAGPADPVFQQVDDALGAQLQQAARPALEQANTVIEPTREDAALACLGLALVGPPGLPPPLSRFDPTYELCYR